MPSPAPNEQSLEQHLKELKPRSPSAQAQARMRSALRDVQAEQETQPAFEQQLVALSPVAPSERLRERIATAIAEERTDERAAETTAFSASTTIAITEAPKASRSTLRIGYGIAAAAAAIALLWFGFFHPAPEPQVAAQAPATPATPATPAKTFPLPFAPVSAERSVVDTEDGGIEHIDGHPVHVLHVNLLDKLEYEQEGRRVIVERPVRQTVYNQLAYH